MGPPRFEKKAHPASCCLPARPLDLFFFFFFWAYNFISLGLAQVGMLSRRSGPGQQVDDAIETVQLSES
jgi:hypothetical protein